MQRDGFVRVVQMICQQRQRELRRTAAAVTPLEPGRTVIPQVEPGIEAAAVDGDINGMPLSDAFIDFHDAFLSMKWSE